MMQAVIMAGGKGTRLRELTHDEIPKPMALVAGKSILQHQIECLRCQGITDIVLIIGYLGEKIRAYFGDGQALGIQIRYIEETTPLGTAGALAMVPPLLATDNFILVFGDVLFDIDLARMMAFHRERGAEATLFVHPNSHPYDSDLVVLTANGRVERFISKHTQRDHWYQNRVNAGFYILHKSICARVPVGTKMDLERELLSGMISDDRAVYGYLSPEYIKDVGTPERIAAAEMELKSGIVSQRNMKRKQKAIFLDRDGTINRENGLVYREDQFALESHAAEAIRAINQSGYLAIVVTNQPVVARGLCSVEDVENIHRKMETLLGLDGAYLDDILFCPHHPDKGYPEENPAYKIPCHCRKPDIGMLEECAGRFNISLAESWMIGDSTVDIQTGKNAGAHTALVRTGVAGKDGKYSAEPDLVCDDLLSAVQEILGERWK